MMEMRMRDPTGLVHQPSSLSDAVNRYCETMCEERDRCEYWAADVLRLTTEVVTCLRCLGAKAQP